MKAILVYSHGGMDTFKVKVDVLNYEVSLLYTAFNTIKPSHVVLKVNLDGNDFVKFRSTGKIDAFFFVPVDGHRMAL